MNEGHDQPGSGVLSLLKTHRVFIIISIIFCVLAASAYLFFLSAKYKVKLRLAVVGTNRPANDVIKDLRSKEAILQVVRSLPLQVRYYKEDGIFKRTELYGDSLPIRFVLQKGSVFNSATKVVANPVSDRTCEVDENDITTNIPLNQPVRFSALRYMILKGPAFNTNTAPVTIKFSDEQDLTDGFSKALDAKVVGDKTFELSVKVNNIQKGRDFLNKLIAQFNSRNANTGPEKKVVIAGYTETLAKLSDRIKILQAKAQKYHQQQTVTTVNVEQLAAAPLKGKQKIALDVLAAIKPYVTKPVGSFVQIPDGYDVDDEHIDQLITQFNTTELDKQRALGADAGDDEIRDLNNKLASLKQDMLASIAVKEQQIKGGQQLATVKTQAVTGDSLAQINALIISKQHEYDNLLKQTEAKPVAASPRLAVVENTAAQGITFSRTLLVYFIALMAGLMLPVILLAISEVLGQQKRMAL